MMDYNRTEEQYLSEEALEKLIAEVENGPLLQAPDYLRPMILNQAKHQVFKDSVEIMPIRNTIRESIRKDQKTAKKQTGKEKRVQLFAYSVKIVAAAAAAIAFIMIVPAMQNPAGTNREDAYRIEYENDRKEMQTKPKKEKSLTRSLNEWSSGWCNRLYEGTNRILEREEQ